MHYLVYAQIRLLFDLNSFNIPLSSLLSLFLVSLLPISIKNNKPPAALPQVTDTAYGLPRTDAIKVQTQKVTLREGARREHRPSQARVCFLLPPTPK